MRVNMKEPVELESMKNIDEMFVSVRLSTGVGTVQLQPTTQTETRN